MMTSARFDLQVVERWQEGARRLETFLAKRICLSASDSYIQARTHKSSPGHSSNIRKSHFFVCKVWCKVTMFLWMGKDR